MAIKIDGKTVKTKVKVPRNPLFLDEKYTGIEPTWDTERALEMDDDTFDHHMRRSFYYYNYFYSQKDTKKYVVEFLKTAEYSKEQIKAFERSADRSMPMTACSLVMANRAGMPLKDKHIAFIKECVAKSIADAAPEEDVPSGVVINTAPKPSIQDRMNEKTAETMGELEGYYDEVLTGTSKFKHYDFFTTNNVPQSQLAKYEEVYIKRGAELEEAQQGLDEQLKEAYSHYKAADFKRVLQWIRELVDAIAQYRNVKKASKKVRAPRAVSKEKVVAKLKYAKEDKVNKLVSINPADIIGAQELWIFNSKTRKLGKYVADALTGPLGVKGTSIIGYNESASVCKTLRKPAEQLKEFNKAGKVQLRKFLDEIKATETKLNGRISADIVLLKVQ